MPLKNEPDANIAALYDILLGRLEERLRSDAPAAVHWFERMEEPKAAEYFGRHPDVWVRRLGSFEASERETLSAVFDIDFGLDLIRFLSDQALAAEDRRMIYATSHMLAIGVQALFERLEYLVKRAFRNEMIVKKTEIKLLKEIKAHMNDHLLLMRDASAHGSFVSTESILRHPERIRMWEVLALSSTTAEPLAWMYMGMVDSEFHKLTRARLRAIETLVGSVLAGIATEMSSQ